MHCQDAQTLELEERCVNAPVVRIPFTCDSVDWFMLGKVVKNVDALPESPDADSKIQPIVVNSYHNSYVDNAILLSGDVSLDEVEDNYKRELREIGAPSMVALFNFDDQPYSHSLNLINNSPVKAYSGLRLSPHCDTKDGIVSSGIEQLDVTNPNYMQFEGYKTRYALDLRDTLTSLSSNHDLHVTREAVLFFGWAEVYKDFSFLKNKFYNGTKVFDYFTLAAASSDDHSCKDYANMTKIVQLRHVVEVRDNQVVNSKVELVFFGKSVFPRRDQYIMREEIAEGSYSYVLRLNVNKESRRATFNFKDGFGKEVQYDTTRDEFAMMTNPVAFIGNTHAELAQQSESPTTDKNSDGVNYTFFNYRYRTFGVSRGVTNHDLCKGSSDFTAVGTDMALNQTAGARRLQAADVFNPETKQDTGVDQANTNEDHSTPALNHLFCNKSQKPFLTHMNTVACAVPDYTEDALCYNQTDLTDGKCVQCKRGFYINDGKCAQCSDSNCDICAHGNGTCKYCKEGFELSLADQDGPSGSKCVACGKDFFWSKMNQRCTPVNLNQYAIFGEGQGVLGDKEFNTLTSNGILLPPKELNPEYYVTGSWTVKTLVEIKGGLSFYIVDGENIEREYVIERFDRTIAKERNITVNFVIKKSDLVEHGKSNFDKVFFRIKNQCCNIENKIRIVDFKYNFYSDNQMTLIHYEPYPMDSEQIQHHVQDVKMHNGSLQIIRKGTSDSGNSWVTIREISNMDSLTTSSLEQQSLQNIIMMLKSKVIRFNFNEGEKSVFVTNSQNQVTAQEVNLNNPDLTVADYKANPEFLKTVKNKMDAEQTPGEKGVAGKPNTDNHEHKYDVHSSNEDCTDCIGSGELEKLEEKIAHQKELLMNQQILFDAKMSKLSSDLSLVQKQKLSATRSELKGLHHELLLQEEYLKKRREDIERQRNKIDSQKQSVRTKTILITKELSTFEKNNLKEQQMKIKALQDKLALKYDHLASLIEKIDGIKTQEKLELKSEEIAEAEEKALGDKPLTMPLEKISGDALSAPQLGVLIKKLQERKGNVENGADKIGDEQEQLKTKINDLAKLKLQREQDELNNMKDVLKERHKDIETNLHKLKLKAEEEKSKQARLEFERKDLKKKIENFEREKLLKRANDLKLKQLELVKTKSDIEGQLRELEVAAQPPKVEEKPVEAAAAPTAVKTVSSATPHVAMVKYAQDFSNSPRPLEETLSHPDQAMLNPSQVQLNARNAKLNPKVASILKITGLCLEDISNLTHRMLHVDQFPILHDFIRKNPLSLTMAVKRCENQYGGNTRCESYLGTMAVKKCPSGYMRIGCCQCVIPCPRGYWPDGGGLFCFKSDPIKGKKYGSYQDCVNDKAITRACELYGVSFFTKACPANFERNGDLLCIQRCPLGWPDYGVKCLKVGNIRTGMPTVWQPGDEEYTDSTKPIDYYKETDNAANRAFLNEDQASGLKNANIYSGRALEKETKYVDLLDGVKAELKDDDVVEPRKLNSKKLKSKQTKSK